MYNLFRFVCTCRSRLHIIKVCKRERQFINVENYQNTNKMNNLLTNGEKPKNLS